MIQKSVKKLQSKEIIQKNTDSAFIMIIGFGGVKATHLCSFRSLMYNNKIFCRTYKNSIIKISTSLPESFSSMLKGNNLFLFIKPSIDISTASKVVYQAVKDYGIQIKSLFSVESKVVKGEQYIKELATLPTKHELLISLTSTILKPISLLLETLSSPSTSILQKIEQITQKGNE